MIRIYMLNWIVNGRGFDLNESKWMNIFFYIIHTEIGMNYIGLEIIGDKRGNYFGNVIYLFNICLIVTHIIDKFLRSGWTTFISWPLKFSKRSLSLSLFLINVACSTMNFFPDNDIILIEDIRDFLPLHSFLPSNFSTFDSFLLVVISIRFSRINAQVLQRFQKKGKVFE